MRIYCIVKIVTIHLLKSGMSLLVKYKINSWFLFLFFSASNVFSFFFFFGQKSLSILIKNKFWPYLSAA